MASKFVYAYNKDTGEKQRIPASWLDHPKLGAPFRKTKPSDAPAAPSAPESTATTSKGK